MIKQSQLFVFMFVLCGLFANTSIAWSESAPVSQVYFKALSTDGSPIRADYCGINYERNGWISRNLEDGVTSEVGITYETKKSLTATLLFRYSDEKYGKFEIRPEEIKLHVVPGDKLLKPSAIERKPFDPTEKGCDIFQYGEWITLKFPIPPEKAEQVALLFPSGTVVKIDTVDIRPFRFEQLDSSPTVTSKPIRPPVSLPDLPPLRDAMFSKEMATAMPSKVRGTWVVDAKATEDFFLKSPLPRKADKLAQWLGLASGYMALFTYEFDGNHARARAYRADKVLEFERISDQDTETTYALKGDAAGKQQTLSVSMLKNGSLRIFPSQSLESGYLIWKPGQLNADTVATDDFMAATRTWLESVQRIVDKLNNPSKHSSQDVSKTTPPLKVPEAQVALDQATQRGAIRKATAEDLKAFRDAYIYKKYTSKNLPVPSTENALSVTQVDLSRAYVVQKDFSYPPGMINENSVVFFIPEGVSEPSGKYGHSAIYHFDTLTVECSAARTGGFSC